MNFFSSNRGVLHSSIAIAIVLMAGVASLVLASLGGLRLVAVIFGGVLLIYALFISNNPRQFLLWLLMLSLPMALSKQFGEIVYKGGGEQAFRLELHDIFVVWLLAYQFRDIILDRVRGLRIPKPSWFWVALILLGVIDTIQGPWRTSAAHELVRMVKVLLLFIVLVNEIKSPKQLIDCITPLALGVLLQGSIGFAQYLKGSLLGLELLGETTAKTIQNLAYTSVEGSLTFRPSALLLHANIFGIYLATMLPLLIGAFLFQRSFILRGILVVSIGIGMSGLILSQSRSAWVAFALAYALLMFLMISHRRLKMRGIYASILSSIALLIVLIPFSERIFTRLFASKADASIGRQVFLEDFFRLIHDHWLFGTGLNSYTYEVVPYLSFSESIYNNWIPPVHNIYFLWWGEMGIFGLLLHLLMWGSIIMVGIQNLKVKDNRLFIINAACLAAMLAFIFDGFLSFSLRVSQPQRVFFVLSAFIFVIHYWRQRGR